MTPRNNFTLSLCLLLLLSACSPATDSSNTSPQWKADQTLSFIDQKPQSKIYKVTDIKGKPIIGATVYLLGEQITTDRLGQFVVPVPWTHPATLSIEALGYIRQSYFNLTPDITTSFILPNEDPIPSQILFGETVHWEGKITEKDGNADIALVTPLFERKNLFYSHQETMMSQDIDYINILGQTFPIPSNISIPKQKEKYGIFTFTLEKPIFRIHTTQKEVPLMAVRATAPVGRLKNPEDTIKIINSMLVISKGYQIGQAGITNMIPMDHVDLASKFGVIAPELPKNYVLVAVPISKNAQLYEAHDAKVLDSKEGATLFIPATGADSVLLNMTHKDRLREQALSSALVPFQPKLTYSLLSLVDRPQLKNHHLQLQVPSTTNDILPVGTYVSLSLVSYKTVQQGQMEYTQRLWEFYAPGWISDLEIPDLPYDDHQKLRWEVTYLGSTQTINSTEILAHPQEIFNRITHATSNRLDM